MADDGMDPMKYLRGGRIGAERHFMIRLMVLRRVGIQGTAITLPDPEILHAATPNFFHRLLSEVGYRL
jgi:hypothetical protein